MELVPRCGGKARSRHEAWMRVTAERAGRREWIPTRREMGSGHRSFPRRCSSTRKATPSSRHGAWTPCCTEIHWISLPSTECTTMSMHGEISSVPRRTHTLVLWSRLMTRPVVAASQHAHAAVFRGGADESGPRVHDPLIQSRLATRGHSVPGLPPWGEYANDPRILRARARQMKEDGV